jgi:hypothetical protein
MCYFTAYVDDSGSDPKQLVANATGLIIPANRLVSLEREWDRLRINEGFEFFHTSDFVNGRTSQYENWDTTKKGRIFSRVRNICRKYGVKVISMTVHKEDYDQIVPKDFRSFSGMHHYTWAIRHTLKHIVQWRIVSKVSKPLAYVFDSMGKNKKNNIPRKEIEDVMEQAQEDAASKGVPGEYDDWGFGNSRILPGLQCADLIAWTTYQYGLFAFRKIPLGEYAEIAWGDFSLPAAGSEWMFAVTVTQNNLKRWIDVEMEDGTSMKKFAEWKERKDRREAARKKQ